MFWRRRIDPSDWQALWHEVLDTYGSDTPRPDPLPSIREDVRLQFDLWQAPPEARAEAFSFLPKGKACAERVEAVLNDAHPPLSADAAEDHLRDALKRIAALRVPAPDPAATILVLTPQDASLNEAFRDAAPPSLDLDDRLPDLARRASGPDGEDAFFFLSEPLFRLKSDYDVAHWALWPLCARRRDPDPYAPLAQLALGRWSAGHSATRGLFLYDRRR